MKKFICIFTAAILALCFSVGVYAVDEEADSEPWWLTNQDDLPNVDMDDPSMPESIGEVIEIPEPEPVIDPELQAENERFFAEMAASGKFPTQGGENPDTGIFPTVTLLAVTAALAVWAKRDRG